MHRPEGFKGVWLLFVFRQGLPYQRLALNLIWGNPKHTCCLSPSCWDPRPGPHLVFSAGSRSQDFTHALQGPYKLSPVLACRRSFKAANPTFTSLLDTAKLISQTPWCENRVLAIPPPPVPRRVGCIELLIPAFPPVWVSAT